MQETKHELVKFNIWIPKIVKDKLNAMARLRMTTLSELVRQNLIKICQSNKEYIEYESSGSSENRKVD